MLTTRQEKILGIIVKEYVKNITPVGSKQICDELEVSSATIRNEMALLEEEGYLEKTHISSGRIPSELGYRYYVDHLMEPNKMLGDEMLKLQVIFNNNKLAIDDCIKKSLEIIAEITDYTSIALGSNASVNKLQKVEVLPINQKDLIAIVVTDKGHVEHKNLALEGISQKEITKTVDLINKLLIGTPINEINKKLELEIKPIIKQYVSEHETIYNAFYDVFNDFTSKTEAVYVGKNNILKQPEFNNIDKIKHIYNRLEDKETLESIEETEGGNINIYIGKESKVDDDVTVIKTKYQAGNEEGTIAIIGPKRMEYSKVVSLLDYIKKNIENKSQGGS